MLTFNCLFSQFSDFAQVNYNRHRPTDRHSFELVWPRNRKKYEIKA